MNLKKGPLRGPFVYKHWRYLDIDLGMNSLFTLLYSVYASYHIH